MEPPTTPAWQLVPDQPARRQIPPAGSSRPEREGIPAVPEQKQLKTESRCRTGGKRTGVLLPPHQEVLKTTDKHDNELRQLPWERHSHFFTFQQCWQLSDPSVAGRWIPGSTSTRHGRHNSQIWDELESSRCLLRPRRCVVWNFYSRILGN